MALSHITYCLQQSVGGGGSRGRQPCGITGDAQVSFLVKGIIHFYHVSCSSADCLHSSLSHCLPHWTAQYEAGFVWEYAKPVPTTLIHSFLLPVQKDWTLRSGTLRLISVTEIILPPYSANTGKKVMLKHRNPSALNSHNYGPLSKTDLTVGV